MLVKTFGSTVYGVNATTITIEVNIMPGMKYFVVGLPDSAVKEGQHRIESALKACDYRILRQKMVINLAPADIRKEGSAYDLPIAIGIMAASDQLVPEVGRDLSKYTIMGELSLDGSIQPIKGALPIAIQARKEKFEGFILPKANAREAAIVNDLKVYGVENLKEVIDFFAGTGTLEQVEVNTREEFFNNRTYSDIDFSDVKGQKNIKRALEIAAAGGHNVILIGPPGAGKTMLAKRMPTILPPLNLHEALEATKIHSVVGRMPAGASLLYNRPFRAPHHTISDVALVGGGTNPQPGEISLAHNGVLFLDELPEFKRTVLEVLRQPMEERRVTISRAKMSIEYPSSFMLIASMNPWGCVGIWDFEIRVKRPPSKWLPKEVKTWGDHIRRQRVLLKMSQPQVARMLKVTTDTVTYWENNRNHPQIQFHPRIIGFLGYNPFPIEATTLGGKIQRYRQLNGLSLKRLAKKLNVDPSTVQSWEANEFMPNPVAMDKVKSLFINSHWN